MHGYAWLQELSESGSDDHVCVGGVEERVSERNGTVKLCAALCGV